MPLRDPSLLHQVVIFRPASGHSEIHVSCNCRGFTKSQGGITYGSMGVTNNQDETKAIYNNPDNHLEEFTKEWELDYPTIKEVHRNAVSRNTNQV